MTTASSTLRAGTSRARDDAADGIRLGDRCGPRRLARLLVLRAAVARRSTVRTNPCSKHLSKTNKGIP